MNSETASNPLRFSIAYKCLKTTNFSAWSLDKTWLRRGETAQIVEVLTADGMNALYRVKRDRDGDERCIYRSILLEYGEIEGVRVPIEDH